jgi:hypothetical protein
VAQSLQDAEEGRFRFPVWREAVKERGLALDLSPDEVFGNPPCEAGLARHGLAPSKRLIGALRGRLWHVGVGGESS